MYTSLFVQHKAQYTETHCYLGVLDIEELRDVLVRLLQSRGCLLQIYHVLLGLRDPSVVEILR